MSTVKIVIRKVDRKYIDDNYERLVASLYRERKAAVKQLKNKEAVYVSITAGRLLQDVIARELGVSPEELVMGKGEHGKPYLMDYDKFYFNISHSGEYVVMAYSDRNVGIDIEKIRPDNMAVAKRCFTDSELEYVEYGNDSQHEYLQLDTVDGRFFHIWTMKESYLKNLGCGISVPLTSFTTNPYSLKVENTDYRFTTKRIGDYLICVCTEGEANVLYTIEDQWISCLDMD
ncbi:MAG: 4'-phosphopantetheinyl transferase family protein [Wujia sp.]